MATPAQARRPAQSVTTHPLQQHASADSFPLCVLQLRRDAARLVYVRLVYVPCVRAPCVRAPCLRAPCGRAPCGRAPCGRAPCVRLCA
eukprot:354254-Chlamydomonas_euryale.AAC.10